MRAFGSALALAALFLVACGGSVDQKGDGSGGAAGGGGAGGSAGSPVDAGTSGCVTRDDCGKLADPACAPCGDGTIACSTYECLKGACVEIIPPCVPPTDGGVGPACFADYQCSAPAVCQVCPDGASYTCATASCVNGACATYFPPCAAQDGGSGGECKSDYDCPVVGLCQVCPDGVSYTCATAMCVGGKCDTYYPPCASQDGGTGGVCKSDYDCPPVKDCQLCADGVSYTCGTAVCLGGTCGLSYPPCVSQDGGTGTVICGGFGGKPCPGSGSCLDIPNDGCNPGSGGADCPGQCVCQVAATCTPNSTWDGSPDVCACVPVDAGSQCQADSECPAVGAPCQLCPDGVSANCPQSLCLSGQCSVHWTGCPSVSCAPQDAQGVGMCAMFLGYVWDGKSCQGIGGCSCQGADCKALYGDPGVCKQAYAGCP